MHSGNASVRQEVLVVDETRSWDPERAFLEELPARLEAVDVRAIADPAGLVRAIQDSTGEIAGSEGNACIGVVGEFRTGKSSLINAIAGGSIALVDIVETTAVPCRYDHGPRREAVVHFFNDDTERLSIEAVNRLLAERRHDPVWLATIDHVEFRAPLAGLVGIELWDAPGFGGSEFNEAIAHRFIERITGALWVLDATLLGNAAIVGPLQRLSVAGKRVLAVLNQVDRLGSPSEVEEAVQYVRETYGKLIADVFPVSAKMALSELQAGRQDAALATLRTAAVEKLVSQSAVDRHNRIGAAVAASAEECRKAIREVRVYGQNAVGLLDHAEGNLRAAASRLVAFAARRIEAETEAAYAVLERGQIERLRKKLVVPTALSEPDSRLSLADADVEAACRVLGSEESQRFVLDAVSGNVQTFLEVEWRRAVERATNLAAIAQPFRALETLRPSGEGDGSLALVPAGSSGDLPVRSAIPSHSADGKGQAVADAAKAALDAAKNAWLVVGGGGSVAAVFAVAVTPLTVVTLPTLLGGAAGLGLVAAAGNAVVKVWKRFSGRPTGVSLAEAEEAVRACSQELARSAFEHLSAEAQLAGLKNELDARIGDAIARATEAALGGRSRAEVHERAGALRQIEGELIALAEGIRQTAPILTGASVDALATSVVLEPGERAARTFEDVVGDVTDQLDVIVVGADQGLKRLFERLGSTSSARILVLGDASTAGAAKATLVAALGSREFDMQARLVGHRSGGRLLDSAAVIITADDAFTTDQALVEIGRAPVRVERFAQGRTAAQRLFASLWTGNTESGEELDVSVLN